MNTKPNLVLMPGAPARVESAVPASTRGWKQYSVIPVLAGFGSRHNSIGVSEVESRHR